VAGSPKSISFLITDLSADFALGLDFGVRSRIFGGNKAFIEVRGRVGDVLDFDLALALYCISDC